MRGIRLEGMLCMQIHSRVFAKKGPAGARSTLHGVLDSIVHKDVDTMWSFGGTA